VAERVREQVRDHALDGEAVDDLLELAKVAAHESGERINAPLVCYLAGLAAGRSGTAVDILVDAVARTDAER
jgi:hypothetical protein